MIKHFITFLILFVAGSGVSYANSLTDPFRPDDLVNAVVAYWPLNEELGSRTDTIGGNNLTSANSNVGSSESDKWATTERSAEFTSGEDHYLEITNAAQTGDLTQTGSFAWGGWFKISGTNAVTLIDRGSSDDTGYALKVTENNEVVCDYGASSLVEGAGTGIRGRWVHLICQYDEDDNTLILYRDGVMDDGLRSVTTNIGVTTAAFLIGATGSAFGAEDHYVGLAKDVFVTERLLTQGEIHSLGFGIDSERYFFLPDDVETPPTAYWRLDEPHFGGASIIVTHAPTLGTTNLTRFISGSDISVAGWLSTAAAGFGRNNSIWSEFQNSEELNLSGSYSVTMWVRDAANSSVTLLDRRTGDRGVTIVINQVSGVTVTHDSTVVCSSNVIEINDTVPRRLNGQFGFYAATYDDVSQEVNVSLNGVNICSGTGAVAPTEIPTTTTGTVFLIRGSRNALSDYAIWNGYVLTDEEINSLLLGRRVQQSGLVSYWNFDGTGATAQDSVGDNDLTTTDTIDSVEGLVGQARHLDGTEVFDITDAAQDGLDFADAFTVITWVRPGDLQSTNVWEEIIGKGSDTTGWRLRFRRLDYFRAYAGGTDITPTLNVATVDGVAWSFLSFSHEQDDTVARSILYQADTEADSLVRQTSTTGNTRIADLDNSGPFYIGSTTNSRSGTYDETQVYARALHPYETYDIFLRGNLNETGVPPEPGTGGGTTPPVTTTRSRVIYIY